MRPRALKKPEIARIKVPGKTIRRVELANRCTKMLVNITVIGRMASVMEKVS